MATGILSDGRIITELCNHRPKVFEYKNRLASSFNLFSFTFMSVKSQHIILEQIS